MRPARPLFERWGRERPQTPADRVGFKRWGRERPQTPADRVGFKRWGRERPRTPAASVGFIIAASAVACLALGCGRDDVWDSVPSDVKVHGLVDAAALVDDGAHRALVLEVEADLSLHPTSLPIGHGYAASVTTPDATGLLVLSRGDEPRRNPPFDQAPILTFLGAGDLPGVVQTFPISDPLSGLAMDPDGQFAIVYPSAADTAFVANPNELSIVDLSAPPSAANPLPITLRSFGGRPESFFFTPALDIAGRARRLLAVLTDRDIGIIDLSVPDKGDITVPLSSTGDRPRPVQMAVSNGAAGEDDARLAVRLDADPNLILVDLPPVPSSEAGTTAHDFKPTPNIVFAGGMPSDIAFVNTDGGLRLAALVPSNAALALIDPATGISSGVDLGAAFERMSLVTSVVGPTSGGADVALLWSTSSAQIAFVALGSTVGKPYRSVEVLTLETPIESVLDVPSPNERLKILVGFSGTLYVLDLVARTASPILASGGKNTNLTLSPDGLRAWIFATEQSDFASLDLETLHPKNLLLSSSITGAVDVSRRGGGRALIALRAALDVDVTVIDGENPSLDTAVDVSSVLLGELP